MSTRSGIILQEENQCTGIYCHWDGYPEGVGKTLKEHYTDLEKIKKLVSLGHISVLEELVEPTTQSHSYETPEPNVTVAYRRDRNEDDVDPKTGSLEEVTRALSHMGVDFLYLFSNGEWSII